MSEDEIILTHILQCRPIDLMLNQVALTVLQQEQYNSYRSRRKSGEPLQYILGTCNFMGLELKVDHGVLIPRPETEQLVDAALKYFKGGRALDLGTGSGNIAIALANFVPQSQVIGIDISSQALEIAKINAIKHRVEGRIRFIHDDFLRWSDAAIQRSAPYGTFLFDLIISNPPYIPTRQLKNLPQDVQQEPAMALDGGEDGLDFYRNIIKYTPDLLREGAYLMMEFGDGQAEPIKKLLKTHNAFSNVEIIKDLAGRDRIIKVIK